VYWPITAAIGRLPAPAIRLSDTNPTSTAGRNHQNLWNSAHPAGQPGLKPPPQPSQRSTQRSMATYVIALKQVTDIKLQLGHNDTMGFSNALSIASLMLSLIAIIVAARMSIHQVRQMRHANEQMHHANELPAFVDLCQEYRSSDLYVIENFILNDLCEYTAEYGYSGLPLAQRKQFLTMLDYMTSMACLEGFDIVEIDHIFAMFGYLFPNMWSKMQPFIKKEEGRTEHEIARIVEQLCDKLSKNDAKFATLIVDMQQASTE
jgi:hypothetical protein